MWEALLEKFAPYLVTVVLGIIASICGGHWKRYIRIGKEIGDVLEEIHKANEDGTITPKESKKIIAEALEAWAVIRKGKGRVA